MIRVAQGEPPVVKVADLKQWDIVREKNHPYYDPSMILRVLPDGTRVRIWRSGHTWCSGPLFPDEVLRFVRLDPALDLTDEQRQRFEEVQR